MLPLKEKLSKRASSQRAKVLTHFMMVHRPKLFVTSVTYMLHGHTERNCRKKNVLHHSNSYQQARSQFNNRQQLVMDQLENSLFAPNVCS